MNQHYEGLHDDCPIEVAHTHDDSGATLDMIANVIFDEPNEDLALTMSEWAQRGKARRDGDTIRFDQCGYLPIYDRSDPQSGELHLMYGFADGSAITVLAPDCTEAAEVERRIIRDVAEGREFTIDDHGPAASATRAGAFVQPAAATQRNIEHAASMPSGGMTLVFAGEAYESFQNAVDSLHGYGVTIKLPGEDEPFDAILLSHDVDAEDGATVRFIRLYPRGEVESAVTQWIEVS